MRGRPRTTAAVSALVVVVIAALVLTGSGAGTHKLRAVFAAALQVVPGEHVEIAGRTVGSISSVQLIDGQAVVGMKIDDSAWPLHAGTVAILRFGSPLGYALRYVQLDPGPSHAPALPDGGLISEQDTQTPVEFDQLAEIFNPQTRANLGNLLDNASAALHGEAPELSGLLASGGRGAEQIAGFESDLAQNPGALGQLLTSGAAISATLRARDPELQALITDAADTVGTLDGQAGAIQRSLSLAPGAMHDAGTTLTDLQNALPTLTDLVRTIAPGAAGLRQIATPLTTALETLHRIGPNLTTTLRDAVGTAPVATTFLAKATTSLGPLTTALSGLAPVLGCLRPYTPELAGALATTVSAYAPYDAKGHYLRTMTLVSPIPAGTVFTPKLLTTLYPNLHYDAIRAPGLNVNQPWYQPQCGITQAASFGETS